MSLSLKGLYRFDEFDLDPVRRVVSRRGQQVSISPKAFEVLLYLVTNPARVVTKEELLKWVWAGSFVEESNLTQHVSVLRKALADKSQCIVTVPGRGYQFTAEVNYVPQASESAADSEAPDNTILLQRVRERTHVLIEETSAPEAVRAPFRVSRRVMAGLAAALVCIAGGTVALWNRYTEPPVLNKVMVADFLNLTGDRAFDHTLKSALEIGLGQSPSIQLMGAGDEQAALTSMEKTADTPLLGDTALEVCRRNRYEALLRGKIQSSVQKDQYDLTLDVVDCASGRVLANYHAETGNKDSLLSALDSLSLRARKKIGESSDSIGKYQVPTTTATTFSFEALQDYETGSVLGNEGKLKECIPYFQKAVEIDPKFALAQASLGTAWFNLGDSVKAGAYAKTAFDLSANVSQIEKFYIRQNYYYMALQDLDATEKNLVEWTQVYPLDATSWGALTNVATQRGDYQTAIDAGEHALKMEQQRSALGYSLLARAYLRANRNADAKRLIAEAHAQDKDSPDLHRILLEIAIIEHDPGSIQREISWGKDSPQAYIFLEAEAIFAADEGKVHESEERFQGAIANSARAVSPGYADAMLVDEARVHEQLSRTERVAEMLREVKDKGSLEYAVTAAAAGEDAIAEAYLKKPGEPPFGTVEQQILFPELKALLALHRHDPAGAIAALAPAVPYELLRPETIEVRGAAYMAAGQADKAEAEFKKLIANPGLEDPMLPRTTLAHLYLARAYALEGSKAQSAVEYKAFLALWKDADPDLPPLVQARRELDAL
jgi:DNA-binding winged helix-turn-helix (wHTH) protein/tetratricopeptide (TPR) repeat protein